MSIAQKLILLVEDDPINTRLIRDFLKFQGYEIAHVDNGLEVLGKLEEKKPDLILMDLRIYGRSGIDVAKDIKTYDEYKEIPLFAVSAFTKEKILTKEEGAMFDEYIEKPITFEYFLPLVETYIGKARE